jgi:hypothetical protein
MMGHADFQECILACVACVEACEHCGDACLKQRANASILLH